MHRLGRAVVAVVALAASLAQVARADVRVASAFGDHMVLQRDTPVTVWGWADPGEKVAVEFAGQLRSAVADKDGAWQVRLAPLKLEANGRELTIIGRTTVKLTDVVVGDVWLCSGQSNMAFALGGCDAAADIAAAELPGIRYRGYWEQFSGAPAPNAGLAVWNRLSPATAGACTAVGFYFARKVHQETEVPIGLLECTVGGTEIECWMPPEAFDSDPALAPLLKPLEDALVAWRKQMPEALKELEAWIQASRKALNGTAPLRPMPKIPGHPNEDREHWVRALSLWNGMVSPLTLFALKGCLWYQGESNGGDGALYATKQKALIESWRKAWDQDLPFYYVQLVGFLAASDDPSGGPPGWQHVREAQRACLDLPRTGMAVGIDVGEALDIHPKNKLDIGQRLALWALKNEYGQKRLEASGPLFKSLHIEGHRARIRFDHVGRGLMVGRKQGRAPVVEERGGRLQRFAIAGADGRWAWAEAVIDGDSVVVSSPAVPEPVAVRYAFSANPEGANLYNQDGLPAAPFRTDP